MFHREQLSVREIARQTGLSRTTIDRWLQTKAGELEPAYPPRVVVTKLDAYAETLRGWLRSNQHRNKRERRTVLSMYRELVALGYRGSYVRVSIFARDFLAKERHQGSGRAYVPLKFQLGEAFQFDWSTEYGFIGGLRRRVDLAHTKLCASRAFWLSAYPAQSHEMLFDAHTRAFTAFGGVPVRGIYDNMKTAVDKIGRGKTRSVNARFQAMTSHYLFEPAFCNVASGWEKGIVEKNVQDCRRHIWREAMQTRWPTFDALNDWLAKRCQASWEETKHPDWPELTVADILQDERSKLMPCPKPFDGYVEHPVRVSSTSLIHVERNRYSVPTEHAHRIVSLRLYPAHIEIVVEGAKVARHTRSFERGQTFYDWRHYLGLIAKKPGALRNGAPFESLPAALRELQQHLLNRPGGDRVMAQVLSAVPVHGLEAVLVIVATALAMGKPSAEQVLYLLTQLPHASEGLAATQIDTTRLLNEEPRANADRYDALRPTAAGAEIIKLAIAASPALTWLLSGVVAANHLTGGGHHVG
jgi:transposase